MSLDIGEAFVLHVSSPRWQHAQHVRRGTKTLRRGLGRQDEASGRESLRDSQVVPRCGRSPEGHGTSLYRVFVRRLGAHA